MTQLAIILLGGTFDPVHNGHIALANMLYTIFQHPITILPTNLPPYKQTPTTTSSQRLEMLNLAFGTNSKFFINTSELEQDIYCCTYKTLSNMRQQLGFDIPIFFLIGSDSLLNLDTWDNWQELFNLTNFIIAKRPNYNENLIKNPTLLREYHARKPLLIGEHNKDILYTMKPSGGVYILDFTPMNISSTKIRELVKKTQVITSFTLPTVVKYILKHNLYR